jgi:hypothetical protein
VFETRTKIKYVAVAVLTLGIGAGCSGAYNPTAQNSSTVPGDAQRFDTQVFIERPDAGVSVLKQLTKQVVIGSTVDPNSGAQNPYGLTIAPASAGPMSAGDLVICNFNAKSNLQGTGESIVTLHPAPGSKPAHVSSDKALKGCDALALDGSDTIWAASMVADDNPVLADNGKLVTNISGRPFEQPWGQIYAVPKSGSPAFYETNAGDGSVVRINLGSKFTYDVIATGFPVNHGKPGTALAPSGLAYDASVDTLYFADGDNNTLVALKSVTKIPSGGVKATDHGMKFTGPNAADARVVFAGSPLNGPISTALLPNGNIVAGNTLDANGKNLLVEISAAGKLLDVRNVDKGAAGALFGIVATGSHAADTKLYFNDDNDNNVQVLER